MWWYIISYVVHKSFIPSTILFIPTLREW